MTAVILTFYYLYLLKDSRNFYSKQTIIRNCKIKKLETSKFKSKLNIKLNECKFVGLFNF